MSKSEKKRLCRIKANKITRFITWSIQMVILLLTQIYDLPLNLIAAVSITLWIYGPCKILWIIECFYHLQHDEEGYK